MSANGVGVSTPVVTGTKWVYLFSELDVAQEAAGGSWDDARGLLGGKGANLADMTRLGVPVPPGFTVTTQACNSYLDAGERAPDGLWDQALEAIKAIEQATGKTFGDRENPLLVSCRSGAKFSMPGMMDTVLNIGLNDEIAESLLTNGTDARFVYDLYRRLIQMFGSVVMAISDEVFDAVIEDRKKWVNVKSDVELTAEDWKAVVVRFKDIYTSYVHSDFPQDPLAQLRLALEAVFRSWNS